MSTRAYSEINLHFTWHVKASLPIITAEIEPRLYKYILSYSLQTKGLIFHEIGGGQGPRGTGDWGVGDVEGDIDVRADLVLWESDSYLHGENPF